MNVVTAVLVLGLLALAFGGLLGFAGVRYRVQGNPVAHQINALLPQTQCGQCGYPGCKPYAAAILQGEADINLCTPGGTTTIQALANLLERDSIPLHESNKEDPEKRVLAKINESICIGCTLCIQACPVDAILGASKFMHTVIAEECTGCALCLPPCPVDCIQIMTVAEHTCTGLADNLLPRIQRT